MCHGRSYVISNKIFFFFLSQKRKLREEKEPVEPGDIETAGGTER